MAKSEDYITLKEAAEISGYAPDYVGQLIRSGKLPGKQIFSNVQWVTTEQAVRKYALYSKSSKAAKKLVEKNTETVGVSVLAIDGKVVKRLYQLGLYLLLVVGVMLGLILFYILSINLEKTFQARAEERAAQAEVYVAPLPTNENGEPLTPF